MEDITDYTEEPKDSKYYMPANMPAAKMMGNHLRIFFTVTHYPRGKLLPVKTAVDPLMTSEQSSIIYK